MTCEEAQELITALVDRELLDPERDSLEFHLQQCPPCRFSVEQEQVLKQTIRSRAERMHAPSELRDRILTDQSIFFETRRAVAWRGYLPSVDHFAPPGSPRRYVPGYHAAGVFLLSSKRGARRCHRA